MNNEHIHLLNVLKIHLHALLANIKAYLTDASCFQLLKHMFSQELTHLDDKGQVRVIGGKLLPYELNHSPTDACQSLQLPH